MKMLIGNFIHQNKWVLLFSLWLLHGVVALLSFFNLPSDLGGFLFGLSAPRFALTSIFIFWIILNFFLIILVRGDTSFWSKVKDFLNKPKTKDIILIVTTFILFIRVSIWILHGLLSQEIISNYGAYLERLTPALNLAGFVSLECILIILVNNFYKNEYHLNLSKFFFIKLGFVLLVFLSLAIVISKTGLGITTNYKGDWGYGLPAVPLLEWQIILTCLLCVAIIFIEAKVNFQKIPHSDFLICTVIWLVTCLIWLSEPVIPSASALEPRAPNYEIYPFIDSQTYDEFAQSVLIGHGFGEDKIPPRSLYIVFLVFLHQLVGQDYSSMINAQTLFFALLPVLLYLLGKEIFGRPIGMSIALFAILRDYTSNFVSPYTGNLSYSKVYLSEIPVAILLLLFLYISIRWIKAGLPPFLAFLLGGVLGLAMLIRTQVIVALPLIILFAIFSKNKNMKALIKSSLCFLISLFLTVSPWLWRNYLATGELLFDSPAYQTINLALRYSRLNEDEPNVMPLSGESEAIYNQRLIQIASDAIMKNPSGAVWGVLNSYFNHIVNNVLLFPIRDEIKNFDDLWIPSEAFWEKWGGPPNINQIPIILFYIFLLSLGIAIAWHRNGWLGLLPLGLNLFYILWTSLALLSGQRFMVATDWSIYLYYMIGLFALIKGFLFLLNSTRGYIVEWDNANPFLENISNSKVNWHSYIVFGLLFFGIGFSLFAVERVFPDKYPPLTQEQILEKISKSSSFGQSEINATCLVSLAENKKLSFTQGRAVYPRYYMAGEGEDFTDKIGYKKVDYGRLVFNIISKTSYRVIFPMSQPPDFFPHASDVTLIYGENNKILFILTKMGNKEKFYISESFDSSACQ